MNQKAIATMVIFTLLGVVAYVLVQKAYPGALPDLGSITQTKDTMPGLQSGGDMMKSGSQTESANSLMIQLSGTQDDGGTSDLKILEKEAAGL